jgi:hypothetical protein
MRGRLLLLLTGLLGAGITPVTMAPATAAAAATVQIVVRPVAASGEAADGFTVRAMSEKYAIFCNYKDPSIGAVSPDIESCSPSAAYAPACWKAATAHHVLCMQDPSKQKLVRFKRHGRFAKTPIAKPRDRAPLAITLTDGTYCKLRIGGAWGPVPNRPNLYGAYSCDHHTAAWLRAKGDHSDAHNGIDESSAAWRIRTGYKHIVWRTIAKAYFVGTAS